MPVIVMTAWGSVDIAVRHDKAGAVRTLFQICEDARLNHRVEVTGGVRGPECAEILREFFRSRRSSS